MDELERVPLVERQTEVIERQVARIAELEDDLNVFKLALTATQETRGHLYVDKAKLQAIVGRLREWIHRLGCNCNPDSKPAFVCSRCLILAGTDEM